MFTRSVGYPTMFFGQIVIYCFTNPYKSKWKTGTSQLLLVLIRKNVGGSSLAEISDCLTTGNHPRRTSSFTASGMWYPIRGVTTETSRILNAKSGGLELATD